MAAVFGILYGGFWIILILLAIGVLVKEGTGKVISLVMPAAKAGNSQAQSFVAFLVVGLIVCFGIYAGLYGEGGFATSSGASTSSGSKKESARTYLGSGPSTKPIGSDVAVRATLNADGSTKREAHIRTYPDGNPANNYSTNPGLYESRYGKPSFKGGAYNLGPTDKDLVQSRALDEYVRKWKTHLLISSIKREGRCLKVTVRSSFANYSLYDQNRGMDDLLSGWRNAGGVNIEFSDLSGKIFADGQYMVTRKSTF